MNKQISIIDSLNDAQRLAVSAPNQAMLILAGAGSGKTRVLVHRIAWQVEVEGLSIHNILAVTFTNKAAREMRGRLEELLQISAHAMWIGTFHGLAHRLLRRHPKQAKLADTFQVMDSDDQLRVIKRLVKGLNIDDSKWPPKQVMWFINGQKDEGVRARYMLESGNIYQDTMLMLYKAYEEFCDRSGLVDFAELLLRAHELLRDNEDVLQFYQDRFKQVHVDEFQDTNTIQYAWLRLLTEGKNNLFVVGDDDQSIYAWRGAKIENIYNFQKHYPSHQVIKLEQNYRSTGNILKSANALINNNDSRMGKELWTNSEDGELISLYTAFNEQDEAYFVVEKIRKWVDDGGLRQDVAILYRSNAQSRQFEEKLMNTATPYRVYGGLRFFERMEIKNALAYLRIMSNHNDDASFERVFNTPTRGIGIKTIDAVRLIAREQQISLWQAAVILLNNNSLSARASNALKGFLNLIKQLSGEAKEAALFEQVKLIVEKSGLIEFYKKEKGGKAEVRIENLEELVNAAQMFDFDEENEENLNELDMFLAHAALEGGEMQADDYEDCVQLMTLHSSKGLEFKLVFLVGLEDGLFPAQQSTDDVARLEEERRLCYVGITRAMQQLYLTHAESRCLYGKETNPRPSRFLKEIPVEFLQEVRIRANVARSMSMPKRAKYSAQQEGTYKLGQRIRHAKFGEGVVLQMEGEATQERVQINFQGVGLKWLMLSYTNLELL
ncbi:MAG: DNA helicase II [Methylococcales symbiont of Hymedesmia sp. n. MRB-2018]|nr:MAG: DNA helicase II [Methylococcales symbiont of Hymedesmia sp. n. MRB-2018]